jgi:hypothetical protein
MGLMEADLGGAGVEQGAGAGASFGTGEMIPGGGAGGGQGDSAGAGF